MQEDVGHSHRFHSSTNRHRTLTLANIVTLIMCFTVCVHVLTTFFGFVVEDPPARSEHRFLVLVPTYFRAKNCFASKATKEEFLNRDFRDAVLFQLIQLVIDVLYLTLWCAAWSTFSLSVYLAQCTGLIA
jgi:hypothetical protein